MRTLASVIEAAMQRSAAEITLQSERPVVFITPRGPVSETGSLARSDLFDMLSAAASDEHQVDLMLGNPIEFALEVAQSRWRIRAIPSDEGILIRVARDGGDGIELSVELDFELNDPGTSMSAPRASPGPEPQRLDNIPAPAEGAWSLEEDDDFEFDLEAPPPPRRTTGSTATAPRRTTGSTAAAPRRTTGSTAAARKTTAKEPAVDGFALAEDPSPPRQTVREVPTQTSPSATTRMEIGIVRSPDADTEREIGVIRDFAALAAEVGPGSLVYLLERGLAEQLANAVQAPTVVLDDEVDPSKLWSRIRGLPSGSILLIKWEDPSWWLGWILRRLEEGYRVFFDTRASTVEGAWRILLGTTSTTRAEAWLAAQRHLVVEADQGGPRLRAFAPPARH